MKAFPQNEKDADFFNRGGMDLRDYFAAKAMEGFIIQTEYGEKMNMDSYCEVAYQVADAMMKARKIK